MGAMMMPARLSPVVADPARDEVVTTTIGTPALPNWLFGGSMSLRIEEVLVERADAIVYRVTSANESLNSWLGVDTGGYRVGPSLFLAVLAPGSVPVEPSIPPIEEMDRGWKNKHRAWKDSAKRPFQKAIALVDPSVAGFPEWRKLQQQDVRLVHWGEGPPPWGVARIESYRRRLRDAMKQARAPHTFSKQTRRELLDAAGHRCEGCGATESLEFDHVVPVKAGGDGTFENGMVLCKSCHRAKTKSDGRILNSPYFGVTVQSKVKAKRRRSIPGSDSPLEPEVTYYVWVTEHGHRRRLGPFDTFAEARECHRMQTALMLWFPPE